MYNWIWMKVIYIFKFYIMFSSRSFIYYYCLFWNFLCGLISCKYLIKFKIIQYSVCYFLFFDEFLIYIHFNSFCCKFLKSFCDELWSLFFYVCICCPFFYVIFLFSISSFFIIHQHFLYFTIHLKLISNHRIYPRLNL